MVKEELFSAFMSSLYLTFHFIVGPLKGCGEGNVQSYNTTQVFTVVDAFLDQLCKLSNVKQTSKNQPYDVRFTFSSVSYLWAHHSLDVLSPVRRSFIAVSRRSG